MQFEELLEYSRLPKTLGTHPTLNSSMVLQVYNGNLSISVTGYPFKRSLPPGTLISHVDVS